MNSRNFRIKLYGVEESILRRSKQKKALLEKSHKNKTAQR